MTESHPPSALRVLIAGGGVAALEEGDGANETMRRAALSLQTARSLGAGRVIRYTGTR